MPTRSDLSIVDDFLQDSSPLLARLISLCSINSGTFNVAGVNRVVDAVEPIVLKLADSTTRVAVEPATALDDSARPIVHPLGNAIVARKRVGAPLRAMLSIHLDTVYGAGDSFQTCVQSGAATLNGPGVADAKGGLVVMLAALEAFEKTSVCGSLGWDVVLNPDEEIGSPGSAPLLKKIAADNHLALVFEPAQPDGAMVSTRKGAGGITFVIKGRAAHSGRDFHAGRSAILAAAKLVQRLESLNGQIPGVIVNCGQIHGGTATNIVPDTCVLRVNLRVDDAAAQAALESAVADATREMAKLDGITITPHGGFHAKPLDMTPVRQRLCDRLTDIAKSIDIPLTFRPTGGASDGNKLAAAGLPVLDSLGPVGGDLHSEREWVNIPSLVERARLVARLLVDLAENGI